MNQMTVVPLTSFIHGPVNAHEGRSMTVDLDVARELLDAGLVREYTGGEDPGMGGPDLGKAQVGGVEQQSSASPAAQASATQTSKPSESGAKATRKGAK